MRGLRYYLRVGAAMTGQKRTIMLVDDNVVNLSIGKNILKDKYNVFPVNSAHMMFELVEETKPDLILLDVEMPEINGYDAIKKLHQNKEVAATPVIFLTAKNDPVNELEGLTLGAVDYISKPFSPPLLLKRIENHIAMKIANDKLKEYNTELKGTVEEKTVEINELQNAILKIVAELVEFRDDTNSGHIERTQKYLRIFIDKMVARGAYPEIVSKWNLDYLIPAAQLYDVGKIAISDLLLNKSTKFSNEELELMKKHTVFGVAAIKEIENQTKQNLFLSYAKIFAGTHHEKWDGTGYPRGLKGADIPLQGRIMAIIDVYDALISARPYKKPIGIPVAERIVIGSSGTSFDPGLIEVFKLAAPQFSHIALTAK
jgi:putative two-component system response regulator